MEFVLFFDGICINMYDITDWIHMILRTGNARLQGEEKVGL